MRCLISRWFLFGLLLGWSLTHASVFGQVVQVQPAPPRVAQPPAQPAVKGGMSPEKLRQALDKAITVDYSGQSLADVIYHIRDRAGLSITIDQMSILQMGMNPEDNVGQFHVKATNEKAGQVLRRFLNNYRLCYMVIEDSVLVTSEEMAVFRQMRQRVSVDLEDVPLKKAVRELARTHGLNLVIDPKVLKESDTPVSLQLENTGIETAVRLLAELASLKAVRMGNVMFITNEDKAKKIRDEEKDQFDNPLNPNFPGVMPAIMRGGFGGGGIAMPPFGGIGGVPGIAVPDPPVPPPPPGIELPPAKENIPAPKGDDAPVKKKVIEIRPDGTAAPAAPPVLDRPPVPRPIPAPPSSDPTRP